MEDTLKQGILTHFFLLWFAIGLPINFTWSERPTPIGTHRQSYGAEIKKYAMFPEGLLKYTHHVGAPGSLSLAQMTFTRQLEMQPGKLSICKRHWRCTLAGGRWHLVLGGCQGEQRKRKGRDTLWL